MATFLSRAASSSQVQLVTAAVVSGAFVAAAILGYQSLAQGERLYQLKQSIPRSEDEKHYLQKLTGFGTTSQPDKEDLYNQELAKRAQEGHFDEEVILEALARNRAFLTPAGLEKLRGAFVIVVGCGGVGSHCTAALARSGVAKLRLIDFDQVTLSSLNRHAVATLADVGIPKVQCLQRRLAAITPWVQFDLCPEKFDAVLAEALLGPWTAGPGGQKPDFVVDAIDNIETKVALLKFCHDHKIPVVSSMGAGCKSDPSRVMVGDISGSTDDRLSRSTRRRLKLLGVTSGITCVFSNEQAGEGKAELMPLSEEEFLKGSVGDLGVMPDFRVRILPVLGTMPAVFGYTVANHVILSITGYPHEYPVVKSRDKMYDGILNALQAWEEKVARWTNPQITDINVGLRIPITVGDVAFLVEEVFRGKSVVSGLPNRLVLIRWRKPEGSSIDIMGTSQKYEQKAARLRLSDLVCVTKDEAAQHEQVFRGEKACEDLYCEEVLARVERRRKEAAQYEEIRS